MKQFYPNDCEMDHRDGPADKAPGAFLSQAIRHSWIEAGILRNPADYAGPQLAKLRASLSRSPRSGASATPAGTPEPHDTSGTVRALGEARLRT